MAMSKKDFIALADSVREYNQRSTRQTRNYGPDAAVDAITKDQLEMLADFCKSQNSAFMRERWLGYIAGENGKNGGTVKG